VSRTIEISPLTRIEGHLSIHTEAKQQADGTYRIESAECVGEMFRGFETILHGRDPMDAQQITQRICGVCPIAHGLASCKAQEMAYGIRPTKNGRLLQNLILAANYLQSHILHFYHLAALDFVDVTAVLKYQGSDPTLKQVKAWVEDSLAREDMFPAAPLLPRFEGDYIQSTEINCHLLGSYAKAFDMRALAHEMCAVFAAKMPHSTSLIPGGCTQAPTVERVLAYRTRLRELYGFIKNTYLPDVVTAAGAYPHLWESGRGPANMLSYGVFDTDDQGGLLLPRGVVIDGKLETFDQSLIAEHVRHGWYSADSGGHPSKSGTTPAPDKADAYSWLKAPRYRGHAMEVGPSARVMVGYLDPQTKWIKDAVDGVIGPAGLQPIHLASVLGRHLSRALEAIWIAEKANEWLDELDFNEKPAQKCVIPASGQGYGLTEAPRGAIGHWLSIRNHLIDNYQCVVPTTWNCSPRDDQGVPGTVEQALTGLVVADPDQAIEAGRVVRSFDPCLSCSVH